MPAQFPVLSKKVFTLIVTLGVLSISRPVIAQFSFGDDVDPGVTSSPTLLPGCDYASQDWTDTYSQISHWIPNANTPIKTIEIALHIFQKDDGTGTFTNSATDIANLNQIIDWVNGYYTNNATPSDPLPGVVDLPDSKIRFELADRIYFYQNTSLHTSCSRSNMVSHITTFNPERLEYMPIVVSAGSCTQNANVPWPSMIGGGTAGSLDAIMSSFIDMTPPAPYVQAQVLAHELAHNLDLLHTYEPSCCHETCDGTNQDYLSDVFGAIAIPSCWHDSGFSCDPYDPTNTCTNNLMGSTAQLDYYLSPMQMGKLHRTLSVKTTKKYVKDGAYSSVPLTIASDETWDFEMNLYRGIVIESGATLTLKCALYLPEQANIIIKPGGKLIIDGGSVDTWCSGMWQGIMVQGNATVPQGTVLGSSNAILQIANGGTIENALIGAYVDQGGIIDCSSGATFRNCHVDVEFTPYTNENLGGAIVPNASHFSETIFETTGPLNDPLLDLSDHVKLNIVDDIYFAGCTFRNTDLTMYDNHLRGTGIRATDASLRVIANCGVIGPWWNPCGTYTPSHFEGLSYGVRAESSNPMYGVVVNKSEFINNWRGILTKGVNYSDITENTFDVGETALNAVKDPSSYGLYVHSGWGYKIEENDFLTNYNGDYGTIFWNNGINGNLFYNNTFANLKFSTQCEQSNTGLKIRCNDYFGSIQTDISITSGAINPFQGTCADAQSPAGNTFSHTCPGTPLWSDIWTTFLSTPIFYSHHSDVISTPQPGCYNDAVVTTVDCAIGYSSSSCPTNLTRPNISILRNLALGLLVDAGALKNHIDDGDTQTLLDLIATGSNGQVKNGLLDASPYLSDKVLITYLESNPPNGNLQQVVLANSPVTDDVMVVIKEMNLSNGIMNLIEAAQTGFSARFDLEMEISNTVHESYLNKNDAVRQYMEDDESLTRYDDIIEFLEEYIVELEAIEENISAVNCELVATCVKNGKHTKAQLYIDNTKVDGEANNFCKLQEKCIEVKDGGKNIHEINAAYEAVIREVAGNVLDKGYANGEALLDGLFSEDLEEIIEPLDAGEERMEFFEFIESPSATGSVYPNPTSGTIHIQLSESDATRTFRLYSLTGILVMEESFTGSRHQLEVGEIDNGVYFYELLENNTVIEADKLVLIE